MLDALLYAVRDAIRRAGYNYDQASCEIMEDGRPAPRCGNAFVSVHGGRARNAAVRNLDERFDFSLTLTMRVTIPPDRVGDQLIARNIELVPLGQRQGFDHKVEQLRGLIHENWGIVVLTGRTPNSANDNLVAWATGTVYGFIEPVHYTGVDGPPRLVGGEWFFTEPDNEEFGIAQELRFADARRMQPQTATVGPFV